MQTNITELVFILDKSGSMSGLESDTIGGFNAMLNKQKQLPGQCRLTTVLFDNGFEVLHDRLDLMAVSDLTAKDYVIGGSTALLDAMGRCIQKVDSVMQGSTIDYRPDKVLFVIITDGMENASRRFSREMIHELVTKRRNMGWEFVFLGANMDAIAVANDYGINPDMARKYANTPMGVHANFDAISCLTSSVRGRRKLDKDWDKAIIDEENKDKKRQ